MNKMFKQFGFWFYQKQLNYFFVQFNLFILFYQELDIIKLKYDFTAWRIACLGVKKLCISND